ncbi:MAG: hypothetical protein ABI672_19335 [Vicinamibacteria bacterium]
MSVVLDALRRVERPESQPGAVGVTVSSLRPERRRSNLRFLFFGVIAGGLLVFVFGMRSKDAGSQLIPAVTAPDRRTAEVAGRAEVKAWPKPVSPSSTSRLSPRTVTAVPRAATPSAAAHEVAQALPPAFLLQAISERDGHPVAIINDVLVKEGDSMVGVRVLRIGAETVELLLANGKRAVVRFPSLVPN